MNAIIPFVVFGVLSLTLFAARKGKLGGLSNRIQNSDRLALEDAIAEKKHELAELEALRAKYPFA